MPPSVRASEAGTLRRARAQSPGSTAAWSDLRALRDQQAIAEAELIVAYNRAASYEPFRRFGRYAATYMADQTAQLEVLAAQQRLRCLHDDVTALWRERQAVAAQMMQAR